MQITEQTSNMLKLQIRGWFHHWYGISLMCGLPILVGLLAIFFTVTTMPQTTLRCHHVLSVNMAPAQTVCKLTSSNWWNKTITTIDHLQGARVGIGNGTDSESGHRVVLMTDGQEIPMTKEYNTRTLEAYQNVAKIRVFINDSGKSALKIHEDHRWVVCLIGGVFILFGIFVLFPKSLVSCFFNKCSGQFYLERKNLLSESEISEQRLDNVKALQIEEGTNDKGKTFYTLKIVLKAGSPISLGWVRKNSAIAQTINQFLDISEQFEHGTHQR